jgi:hypothetical protein
MIVAGRYLVTSPILREPVARVGVAAEHLRRLAVISLLLILSSVFSAAQATGSAPASHPTLPLPIQMKKTVVFLETDCLHDFGLDLAQTTPEMLAKMSPEQAAQIKQRLVSAITRLQKVRQSMMKLGPAELIVLAQSLPTLEIRQLAGLAAKMSSLSEEEIGKLTPEEVALLPADTYLGTGFIVILPDKRLPVPREATGGQITGFGYLITNRHVVQPGIDRGQPCRVLNYSVLLNRNGSSPADSPHAEQLRLGRDAPWHFSPDDSVDLAVSPFTPPAQTYDFVGIPTDLFVTDDAVDKRDVVEGDPVLFSGLFIQSFNEVHTLEPIVRSGILAMVPNAKLETTLHKPGRVYLTEAHAFAGNSGSPVFVETTKFSSLVIGGSYKLLGAISGEVFEASDLTLHVTASYNASIQANSDISVVVPAGQILDILNSPSLQAARDAYVAQPPKAK